MNGRCVLLSTVFMCGAAACTSTHHFERNAPGHVDVQKPPEDLPYPAQIAPEDPGEHVVSLTLGPQYQIGGRPAVTPGTTQALGVEVMAVHHVRERTHQHPPSLQPGFLADPATKLGAQLGWMPIEWGRAIGKIRPGPVYVEGVARPSLVLVAVGYHYDPALGTHGPQMTVSPFGVNRFRVAYQFEPAADQPFHGVLHLSYVLTVKYVASLVWSR